MKTSYKKELAVAKHIAKKAGVVMRKYFFKYDQGLQRKKDDSPITTADIKINRLVIKELQNHFTDGIIGEEESTARYGMGRRWLCDPIDGTKAFVWGTPTAMFSLGLVVDGVPVLGVAYDPFLDMLYEGIKGGGSFCNGKRLHVSKKGLAGEYIAVSSNIEKIISRKRSYTRLLKMGARLGTFSGAVYKACLVARGKFVGYFEAGVNAHDVAAVQVIVEEAGGKVTGFGGEMLDYSKPFKSAIVSNGIVHETLVKIVETSLHLT